MFSLPLVACCCPLRSCPGHRWSFILHLRHVRKKPLRLSPPSIQAGFGNPDTIAGTQITMHGSRAPTYSRRMSTHTGWKAAGTVAARTGSGSRATGAAQKCSRSFRQTAAGMPSTTSTRPFLGAVGVEAATSFFEVGGFFCEAEPEQVLASVVAVFVVAEERGACNRRNAGVGEEASGLLFGVGAGDARSIGEDVVRAGGDRGRESGADEGSADHVALGLVFDGEFIVERLGQGEQAGGGSVL